MSKSEVRSSQLLTTFGPGAMMDLPDGSVIVGGLDNWRYASGAQQLIDEPSAQYRGVGTQRQDYGNCASSGRTCAHT